jgi:hypothetical protein
MLQGMLMTDSSAENSSRPERDSLPGTLHFIRTLLAAQIAPDWQKLHVAAQVVGDHVNGDCSFCQRGSDQHSPIALTDVATLYAALRELRQRMQQEISYSWRSIELDYDVDNEYSVAIRTV